jgi:hypothetical protein
MDLEIKKVSLAEYYDVFNITDLNEITLASVHHKMHMEVANVGAGAGGGFENKQELQVMKYDEAINGPDGERWKAKIENEYQQMVHNNVFQTVMIADRHLELRSLTAHGPVKRKVLVSFAAESMQEGLNKLRGSTTMVRRSAHRSQMLQLLELYWY